MWRDYLGPAACAVIVHALILVPVPGAGKSTPPLAAPPKVAPLEVRLVDPATLRPDLAVPATTVRVVDAPAPAKVVQAPKGRAEAARPEPAPVLPEPVSMPVGAAAAEGAAVALTPALPTASAAVTTVPALVSVVADTPGDPEGEARPQLRITWTRPVIEQAVARREAEVVLVRRGPGQLEYDVVAAVDLWALSQGRIVGARSLGLALGSNRRRLLPCGSLWPVILPARDELAIVCERAVEERFRRAEARALEVAGRRESDAVVVSAEAVLGVVGLELRGASAAR